MSTTSATATRLLAAEPRTDGLRRDELRGVSAGVRVGAVMGLAWAASALGPLSPAVAVPVAVAGVAIFAVLMVGARRLRRVSVAMPQSAPAGVDLGRVRRRFTLVVAAECAVIAAAATILAVSGHTQWTPAVICATVGLHFVPLARLFRVSLYYATAVALCLVAVTTMILGAASAPAAIWQLLPGLGAALVLWATSAGLLVTTPAQ
ncbi:MAG: hypothetical protein QOE15_2708 [Acidimicrobiaceae bacterium]|nr:hypothetical protein [Acidimicrobiaceae bacterium]